VQSVQDQGVEGGMLWRGGEAMALQKLDDRFTIQLSSFAVSLLSHLAQQLADHLIEVQPIGVKSLRLMPFVRLAELQVEAHHLEAAMQIARSNQAIAFASHVYQLKKSPNAELYLTDQITLQFAEDVSADRMGEIAAAMGLQVLKLVPGVAKGFVFRVMPQAAVNPLKLAQKLMLYPEIWLAEPNLVTAMQPCSDRLGSCQLSSEDSFIDLEAVWQITQGDRSTVIAVMEEAIDFSHPDFNSEGKIVAPFRLRQSLPYLSRLLSHAVGKPAAVENFAVEKKQLSIAPGCALMPIAMDGCLDDQSIEEMFEGASQQGADVILCDWRAKADYFPLSLRQRMAIARAATQGRAGKGCVIVFSIGDSYMQSEKAQSETLNRLSGFALHPDVIAVASSRLKLPIGVTIMAANGMTVAEVAALMLSVNPDLTAQEVKQILRETADSIGGSQPDLLSGLGYGRVNAFKALQMAQQQVRRSLVAQWIQLENLQAIEIPDAEPQAIYSQGNSQGNSQGAFSAIWVEGDRLTLDSVIDIEISLRLEHDFASDLQIYLTAPNGETVLLQNRGLGRLDSLSQTYSLETTPPLKRLLYQSASGEWRLQLIDRVPSDTGRLVSWMLRLGV
jgi:subtilisin-like proprotein convertase family protein